MDAAPRPRPRQTAPRLRHVQRILLRNVCLAVTSLANDIGPSTGTASTAMTAAATAATAAMTTASSPPQPHPVSSNQLQPLQRPVSGPVQAPLSALSTTAIAPGSASAQLGLSPPPLPSPQAPLASASASASASAQLPLSPIQSAKTASQPSPRHLHEHHRASAQMPHVSSTPDLRRVAHQHTHLHAHAHSATNNSHHVATHTNNNGHSGASRPSRPFSAGSSSPLSGSLHDADSDSASQHDAGTPDSLPTAPFSPNSAATHSQHDHQHYYGSADHAATASSTISKLSLAKRLGILKKSGSVGLGSASASSVHQIFQERLLQVVRVPCSRLPSLCFTVRPVDASGGCDRDGDAAACLHERDGSNSSTSPVYTSEWSDMSLNPSWEVVHEGRFEPHADLQAEEFLLAIFALSTDANDPASATSTSSSSGSATGNVRHFVERRISLSDMEFVGKDLADIDRQFRPNTVLIELNDGIYLPATDRLNARVHQDTLDSSVVLTKVDASKVRSSYGYQTMQKIVGLQRQIWDTARATEDIVDTSNRVVAELDAQEDMHRECLAVKRRTSVMEKVIMDHTQAVQAMYLKLEETRAAVRQKREQLVSLQEGRQDARQSFLRARDGLALTRREMSRTVHKISAKRKHLIRNVLAMFPLGEVDKCPTIRGIKLPNTNFAGQDEERIATALGFTVHFVSLLAYYLDVPLRYYMLPISSRSTIWDVVSLQFQGSKEFPLFSRGSERIRFEYAVFLINKNVEQLLNCVGRPVKNLRNTLPNLKLLCDTINTWPDLPTEDDDTPLLRPVDWTGVRSGDDGSVYAYNYGQGGPGTASVSAGQPLDVTPSVGSAPRVTPTTLMSSNPISPSDAPSHSGSASATVSELALGSSAAPATAKNMAALGQSGMGPSVSSHADSLEVMSSGATSSRVLLAPTGSTVVPAVPSDATRSARNSPDRGSGYGNGSDKGSERGMRRVASAPRLSFVSRLLWGASGVADPLKSTAENDPDVSDAVDAMDALAAE